MPRMNLRTNGSEERPVPSVVLIVEDNAIIAMNTESLLLDLGVADVRSASSVTDALALMDEVDFQFAILDLRLSEDETSLPVAERLLKAGTPFVFATGFGEEADMPAGFSHAPILKKPYGFEDLSRVLRG
ncbi:response regulator [Sphingobium lignivorans]|uniref:CheY-like chemotaxis protein n=1 Tax=Sphingobium lignivorans TaxID=2735886 RepID=A0ABR6NCJ6_9SPHN|nr:response regulator [Sphingobium lignivorans]MBB5985009.1 CheY-like chemotaxis protein [Sphingobium lignivorans]